ncbi:DUF2243 domain-containing protein [Halomarina oriensis]|uniref:DUF2243 domain-containing protein n=1 Tax=Halomarina oriensis TaxID=671145 RepID=A0A6B0GK43_9EURY|nr:DUF2243 domain-containing protein [Halomarina oriensis]MWG35222.1 DUF2243 domain-containing protein [Halomarina oriensis]
MTSTPTGVSRGRSTRALVGAGVFGFGVSALVDVLLLHHVLQWHHLVSARVSPNTVDGLRTNLLADGLFSLVMLAVAGVGVGLMWRAERRTAAPLAVRPLAGVVLVGVGLFDLFDVVVDHTLLGLHHALSQGGTYDPYWALVSLGIVALGVLVYRSGRNSTRGGTDGPA